MTLFLNVTEYQQKHFSWQKATFSTCSVAMGMILGYGLCSMCGLFYSAAHTGMSTTQAKKQRRYLKNVQKQGKTGTTNTKTKVKSVASSLCSDPFSSSRNWHRQHFRDHPDFQHNGWVLDNFDTASISCYPESTTSPAELTKRFGQTMKHAGFLFVHNLISGTFLAYIQISSKMLIIQLYLNMIRKAFLQLLVPAMCYL